MFNNIKIRSQLLLLVSVGAFLCLISIGIALKGMVDTKNRFSSFIDHDQTVLITFTDMYAQGLQMGQAVRNIQLDPANPKAFANLKKAAADFEKAVGKAQQLCAGDKGKMDALAKISALRDKQRGVQEAIGGGAPIRPPS